MYAQLPQEEPDGIAPTRSTTPDKVNCVDSPAFSVGIAVLILANTTVIGFECQDIEEHSHKQVFKTLEILFCLLYTFEVILRLRTTGPLRYFLAADSMERGWNAFDFLTTLVGLIGLVAEGVAHIHLNASVLRLLRVLRILRVFRILKFMKDIEYTLVSAMTSMVRIMFLVLMIDFIGAVVITHLLHDSEDEVLLEMFGDLTASMYHLFIVMVDGMGALHVKDHTQTMVIITEKVTEVYPHMWIFWTAFVFIGTISLMALVPAIFVELNLRDAEQGRQVAQKVDWERRVEAQRNALEVVFAAADQDKSNAISRREMDEFLLSKDVLKRCGLDRDPDGDDEDNEDALDVRQLRMEFSMVYDTIEAEGRYELSCAEFIDAFRQMRAKPMDQVVLTMQQEIFKLRTLMTNENQKIKDEILSLAIPPPGVLDAGAGSMRNTDSSARGAGPWRSGD